MSKWSDILEATIIGKVVTALVDAGFRVEMSNQDGGGLFVYAASDNGKEPADGWRFWVRLQPGNGADTIVDYTTNLEATLKEVNAFAAQYAD